MDRTKLEKLVLWFKKQKEPPQHFQKVHVVSVMSAIPNDLGQDIYIVEKDHQRTWAVFECPCDTSHRLVVNLARSRRPSWGISVRKNKVSLWPSLWLKGLCNSHFWIRNSRVYWARADIVEFSDDGYMPDECE
jgi:Family of unknown function (DUF6527)